MVGCRETSLGRQSFEAGKCLGAGATAWHDLLVIVLLEILVIGAAVFGALSYALRGVGGMLVVPPDDGDDGLPPGRLTPAAVDEARFGLAFRGYRMDDVDRVLDRLRDELSARDAEIAVLRGEVRQEREQPAGIAPPGAP